jgi:hypothetical protein
MDLTKIIAISGYPGLFRVIAQANNGIIVESLVDKKRMPAYSHYKISALEDISIFTSGDDVPLKDVFRKIRDKQAGQPAIGAKASNEELKAFFEAVLPEYDRERVHVSDMKKAVSWYNILQANDLLKEVEAADDKAAEGKSEEKVAADKPAKKAPAKKATAKVKAEGNAAKPVTTKAPRKTATVRKTGA